MRYARCAACFRWRSLDEIVVLGCPACFFQTARCLKCGGVDGAVRSLYCHFAYWRSDRGQQGGGHSKRLGEWASYQSALAQIKASEANYGSGSTAGAGRKRTA